MALLNDGTASDSLQLHRLSVRRDFPDDNVVNPPELLSPGPAHAADFQTQADGIQSADFIEADLDTFDGPDGSPRSSLEPGVAFAGRGLESAGCFGDLNRGHFCLTWMRPLHTPIDDQDALPDHRFAGTFARFGLRFPNFNFEPASDVAIATGTFDPALGPSIVVAWVQTQLVDEPTVRVAHVVAVRNGAGEVTGLQLVDPPGGQPFMDLGPAYRDPSLGLTSPSLAVGDFTGAGHDQIAVTWAPASSTPAQRKFSAALLDAGPTGALHQAVAPQALSAAFDPQLYTTSPRQISPGAVALHDRRGPDPRPDWLVVGPGVEGDEDLYRLLPSLEGTGSFDFRRHFNKLIDNVYRTHHSTLESLGDLDGDGLDEVASSASSAIAHDGNDRVEVIKLLDEDQAFMQYQAKSTVVPGGFEDTAVIDARPTKDQRIAPVPGKTDVASMPQIAVASLEGGCTTSTGVSGRRPLLSLWSIDSQLNAQPRGSTHPLNECRSGLTLSDIAPFALDGRFELGPPVQSQFTSLEPSVVLNAPPTHFDVLDGEFYDVNFCYAGNQYAVPDMCFFNSEYEREQTAETEVTSEATEDWAVSAKGTFGFKILSIVDIESEVRGGYGEKFTNIDGATTKDTVNVTVKSRDTDKIYAIRRAYDTFEYPLYQPGGDEPIQYLLSATPHTISRRWLDSSSPDAVDVATNHQPGNILSYPENAGAEENPFAHPTQGTNGQDIDTFAHEEFELSDFSDYEYRMTDERMDADSAAKQKEWNIGATLKAGGEGIVKASLEVSGDYKNSKLTTTKTSVGNTTRLTSLLGGIDESFGETAYTVKPFAYWTENATLMMDYAVEPSVASPGMPKTWWQQEYGIKPDLTLNLPRLLDYEEQAGISSDAARFISPGVSVLQGECASARPLTVSYAKPGQPLCLTAQVQNYSLKDQPEGDTKVEFYDADPDVGGKLLGTADVPAVAAREAAEARLNWTPDARYAGTFPRIFAKVDAGDEVEEIHETNNKGFRLYHALVDPAHALHAPEDVAAEVAPDGTLDVEWTEPATLAATQPPGHSWRVIAYPDAGGDPVSAEVDGDATAASFPYLGPGVYRVAVFSILGDESSPASHPSEPVNPELGAAPSVAFTEGPEDGSYSGRSVGFAFDTAPFDATTECVVDGLPRPCSSPLQLSGLADGAHTLQVRATSPKGTIVTPLVSWIVDGTTPEASILRLPRLADDGNPSLRYSGADEGGSGLAGYEIKTRRTGPRGSFTTDPVFFDPTGDSEAAHPLDVPEGETVCASVRAVDGAGNRSPWTPSSCTTQAFDESELDARGAWHRVRSGDLSSGHALETSKRGPSLDVALGRTAMVKLLAGRCAGCGKVLAQVRGFRGAVASRAVIDLSTTRRIASRIDSFPAPWPSDRTGRLELTSLGGGPVRIDGVAALRTPPNQR